MSGYRQRPYDHPARRDPDPEAPSDKCRVCGRDLAPFPPLRHADEAVKVTIPAVEDREAYSAAREAAVNALRARTQPDITDEDAAELVIAELYRQGRLRRRPAARRPATVAAAGRRS